MSGRGLAAFLVVAALLTGCTEAASGPAAPVVPSSESPSCPTLAGQDCLGRLAGGTYRTRALSPPLTYTVPAGWSNRQDRPGNFVLLAPGFKAAGINDATSDFISVFSAVVLDSNCHEAHPRGVTTPAAMTRWLQRQPGLTVAHVGRVSVGGLHGTVQDVSLAPGWKRSCYGWTYGAVPLFSGEPPSSLVHMVTAGLVMRIYLLRSSYFGRPDVLAIEINDVDPVDSLSAYTDIVETFRFGRPM